ncbi:MAG: tetratricopeptide repeat protein [Nitrospinae bacterium]|nr:tetratricopeptide repeat protein [Nitrospinota bacterium]
MHDELNSYCGDGVRMEGKLLFKGALRFEGYFKGAIETPDTLIVGPSGKINAKVDVGSLFNMGEINGDIRGFTRISILAGSKLTGNIDTPAFISEEGALFRGMCTMPESLPAGFFEPKESKLKKTLNTTLQTFWASTGFGQPRSADGEKEADAAPSSGKKKVIAVAAAVVLALVIPSAWFVIRAKDKMGTSMASRYVYETFAGSDAQKLLTLGDAYFEEGHWRRASAVYERVKELAPLEPEMVKRLAMAQENAGDVDASAANYFEYLSGHPKDDKTVAKLKEWYAAAKDTEKLIALNTLLLEKRSDMAETAAKELFALYTDTGKTEQALAIYRDKIAQSQRNFDDLMTIGRLQKKLGRVNESIETFTEAAGKANGNKDVYYELAYACHKAGLEDKSMEYFNVYARLDPGGTEAVNNQGYINLAQGKTDKAMEMFQTALQGSPNNIRSFLGLAITYSRRGDAGKAEDFCKKILEIDADYAPALNRLAWLYAQQKRKLDDAQKYSIASMRYNENVPDYIDTLSEIYFQRQDYDKAIGLIEKAIKLRPANPYFHAQLEKFRAAQKQSGGVN